MKPYGKGRIFNTSFGHMASLYSNPQVLQFYLDAIQFAAGDLEAPTAPRESRPVRKHVPGTQPAPGLEPGFVSLFDGKTLDGWEGDRTIWSVQDGAITGQTTADTGLKENNFLIWKDQVENFELRLKFRLEGGNSGIYYRAQKRPAGQTQGDPLVGHPGRLRRLGPLDRRDHGVPAPRRAGRARPEGRDRRAGQEAGDGRWAIRRSCSRPSNPSEWNDYTVIAKGGSVVLKINGVTMCELDDRDPKRLVHGWLALQVHVGPPMRVQFKDIYLRRL